MIRVLSWILVAIIIYFVDKLFLKKKSKMIWIFFLLMSFLVAIFTSNLDNQFLEDILIIVIGVSTVSLLTNNDG